LTVVAILATAKYKEILESSRKSWANSKQNTPGHPNEKRGYVNGRPTKGNYADARLRRLETSLIWYGSMYVIKSFRPDG